MNTSDTSQPKWRCRHLRIAALLPLFAAALFFTPYRTYAASKEYQVKAVFIYNFAQFVRWPSSAFSDAGAPLTIGVLGDDPFGGALETATQGESIRGRQLAIKRSRTVGGLKGCQIIFISKSENSRLGEIFGALKGQGILTVGESAGFCAQGGMLNFTIQDGNVHVEIHLDAVKREGLGISSNLIKSCTIFRP